MSGAVGISVLQGGEDVNEPRADAADCETCKGKKTIKAGTTKCPDCNGTGKVAERSAGRNRNRSLAERRSRDHHGYERRSFDWTPGQATEGLGLAIKPGAETRSAGGTDADTTTLSGHVIVWDAPYTVTDRWGSFEEVVSRGAVTDFLADSANDSTLQYDHEGLLLARRSVGSLRIAEDTHGCGIEVDLCNRMTAARDVAVGVELGIIRSMSMGFSTAEGDDVWNSAGTKRKINRLSLPDCSIVGNPCSTTTDISLVRSEHTDDERQAIPATREARVAASLSFGDTQSAVYAALGQHLANSLGGEPDVWILEMGTDYVIFGSWGEDLTYYKLSYSIDADSVVTFEGDPVPVQSVTTWNPVEEPSDNDGDERARQLQMLDIRHLRLALS